MTQADLNRAVAAQTGESIRTIARLGFTVLEPSAEDLEGGDAPVLPLTVDWDQLEASRWAA